MAPSEPAHAPTRRVPRALVVGLLVVMAAIVVALGSQLLTSSSVTVTSSASTVTAWASAVAPSLDERPEPPRGARGEDDGAVPDGTTVFDDEVPGVANLDPTLLGALRQAATDAAADGVELRVNSGWRSAAYQEQLLREAVSEYGSEEEAARWVATPETSLHVSGDAVDIGPSEAASWLSEHGVDHGLCRIYGNEPWHFELRLEAIADGCPDLYADPTQDPRMQG